MIAIIVLLAILAVTGWVGFVITIVYLRKLLHSSQETILALTKSNHRLSEGRDRWEDKDIRPGKGIPVTDLAGFVSPLNEKSSPVAVGTPITLADVERTMPKMAPGWDEIISGAPGRDKNKSVLEYDSDEEFFKSLEDAPLPPVARSTYSPPEAPSPVIKEAPVKILNGEHPGFSKDIYLSMLKEDLVLKNLYASFESSPIFDLVKAEHPDLALR